MSTQIEETKEQQLIKPLMLKSLKDLDPMIPKILLLGKCQQGKSTFVKHMSNSKCDIKIGNGLLACTKDLGVYEFQLRGTSLKI